MKKLIKFLSSRNVMGILGMVIGTLVYCVGIVWVVDLGDFYSGGVTGIAQLTETVVKRIADVSGIPVKSIVIIVLNAPLFIMGWGGVSKRFAVLSLASVLLQSVFIYILEIIDFNPFAALGGDTPDIITLAILGGLITGAGCGICLRYGSSTGGMDILSQFYSLKKNSSFAKFSMSVELVIIGLAAIIGSPVVAVYTIIRMIISIIVLDKIHTSYKYMKLSIITEEKQRMREMLITRFNHGVTVYTATGAYTNRPKYVFETVVSSYEVEEYKNAVKQVDKSCFITFTAINGIDGFFNKNIIT